MADDPAHWTAYLTRQLVGPQRTTLLTTLAQYSDPTVDQTDWEVAATSK
ncbi:MAG: hypothetical protein HYR94_09605 [Chloroflexi bacterium]|nr:hypothetical protein [Chloroflexota bacterium]